MGTKLQLEVSLVGYVTNYVEKKHKPEVANKGESGWIDFWTVKPEVVRVWVLMFLLETGALRFERGIFGN